MMNCHELRAAVYLSTGSVCCIQSIFEFLSGFTRKRRVSQQRVKISRYSLLLDMCLVVNNGVDDAVALRYRSCGTPSPPAPER